jgi:hypothetical protein
MLYTEIIMEKNRAFWVMACVVAIGVFFGFGIQDLRAASEYKIFSPPSSNAPKWILEQAQGYMTPACSLAAWPTGKTDHARYVSFLSTSGERLNPSARFDRVLGVSDYTIGQTCFTILGRQTCFPVVNFNAIRNIVNGGSNSYFIPNATPAEWSAFLNNKPADVTVRDSWVTGSCTTDTHAKGYGCHLSTDSIGNYTLTCHHHNENHGEWTGTITTFPNVNQMSAPFHAGSGEYYKGAAVDMNSDGSRTLTSWGKQNNHTTPYYSQRQCKAGGLRQ